MYCSVTNFSLLLVSLYSLQPSCLPSSAQCNIAWDYRQQTGPINWWKMFVFLSSVRWQVKSLFCCGSRSLAGPFCSEDRTVVHWYAFWPAPVFCCLVFDIDRKPMLWNRMQWVSSQQEAKTLAISSRRQTPVLHLCHTELRCISSAFSNISSTILVRHFVLSFCVLKCFISRSVISGCDYVQKRLALPRSY